MRRSIFIFVCLGWLAGTTAVRGIAPEQTAEDGLGAESQPIDGVAARIEDDILTDSEVRELGNFQQLVEGESKPRDELIRELADQWIVRGEADASRYPKPSEEDVERAYRELEAQFPSHQAFDERREAAGLSEAAVRRMLAEQLYLSRFLDYRFRPAAQVDQKQIEAYYDDEFVPELKARGEGAPPLDDVDDTIREVLIQRDIDSLAKQWLDNTRSRLKIDIVSEGGSR